MGVTLVAPSADQIEVSLFGPGYGECAVVHIGSNNWIIVDSCLDTETREPAGLKYLREIDVDPATAVKLIVCTHWHDDHIRGLARVVTECTDAKVALSAALNRQELVETIIAYDEAHGTISGSGTSEMREILHHLRIESRPATRALANRPLFTMGGVGLDHGHDVVVTALSPSDAEFERFLEGIGELIARVGVTKHRLADRSPNHLSVVTWIAIGPIALLMGADLEESGSENLGWSAIVAMTDRPAGRACMFKIPHHGSRTAHHDQTWSDLLDPQPLALLTPWNRGQKLPTVDDVERIARLTPAGFATSSKLRPTNQRRSHVIEKQIKETVGRIYEAESRTGHVRLRNRGAEDPLMWCIELSDDARNLRLGMAA